MKERLDILLVKRNLAPSREKAKAMIMEGNVFVNNQREDKAGSSFDENVPIEIHGNTLKYVSRGGLKLEKAMNEFDLTLEGDICMDIGASTGGFTDCMLQNGATKVYSVDVVLSEDRQNSHMLQLEYYIFSLNLWKMLWTLPELLLLCSVQRREVPLPQKHLPRRQPTDRPCR